MEGVNLIAYNFSWMGFNTFLALMPVILAWLFYLTQNKHAKYALALAWMFFVPNSIYLFTDLIHLFRQWGMVGVVEKMTLALQFSVLLFVGLMTFIMSMYPIEKFLHESKRLIIKRNVYKILILLNFVIGLGITLGRVERLHSWHVITNTVGVLRSFFNILLTAELLLLTILFGLFVNFLYFLLRDPVIKYINTYLIQVDEKL